MKKAICYTGLIALLLLSAGDVRAHTCSIVETPAQVFERASAVFIGEVVGAAGEDRWAVAVRRVWKGDVAERIMLADFPAKEYETKFKVGVSYLFIVSERKFGSETLYGEMICSWTTRLMSWRIPLAGGKYVWAEDWVLKGRGKGKPPLKPNRRRTPSE